MNIYEYIFTEFKKGELLPFIKICIQNYLLMLLVC